MKNLFTKIIYLIFLAQSLIKAQNITNTLGSSGVFTIKDGTTNFFTLSQSTGNTSVLRNFELGNVENSTSSIGVITKSGVRFIHNYKATGTDGFNTFIGIAAGNFSMSGSGVQASYNTGFGYRVLNSLSSGYYNSAFGSSSLYNNTTGYYNSAFGVNSLFSNSSGQFNSALGFGSLYYNSSGNNNSAFGYRSLFTCTGSNNTAIGYNAGSDITTGSNNIVIGYNAQVPTASANNQIRLGNTDISYAGIQVAWTITSDIRWKENIQPISFGLDFISNLNPVSYTRKNDEQKLIEFGLIAQEVKKELEKLGINNSGLLTIDDKGNYEIRYNDLFAPIIKSIQELKSENDELKSKLSQLEELQENILKEIAFLKTANNQSTLTNSIITK